MDIDASDGPGVNALLDEALRCAARGWPVLPLHGAPGGRCSCGKADCLSPGKHPRTRHGFKDASTDVAVVRRWWAMWPAANVGLRTGAASGLLVLDVDAGPGKDGPRELADLEARHGPLPETPQALTGGRGVHYFFRHPGGRVMSTPHALGPGLDLRADDAYVVAPPSVHASGRPYDWEVEHHPDALPLADVPAWVLNGAGRERPPAADRKAAAPPAEADAAGPLRLSAAASPPVEKFEALRVNDPKFQRIWDRRRPDLPSQSEHDLALADVAVRAGWSDAEIAALIIAHRRAGGQDVQKALRQDYISATVAKARASLREGAEAAAAQEALAEAARATADGEINEGRRAELLRAVSKVLGVEVAGFEQLGRDPASSTFTLSLADGRRVPLGRGVDVLSLPRFRAAVFVETGRAVSGVKAAAWNDLINILGRVREVVENPQADYAAETVEWLQQYLSQVHVFDDKRQALLNNDPFIEGKDFHVHAGGFLKFCKLSLQQTRLDSGEIWGRLKSAGFAPVHVAARVEGVSVTRRYWRGPDPRAEGADAASPPSPPYTRARERGAIAPPQKGGNTGNSGNRPGNKGRNEGGRWQQGGNKWQHWGLTTRDFTRPRRSERAGRSPRV